MKDNLRQSNSGEGISIAAVVLGVISCIASFIPCFDALALIGGILAIVFGAIGLSHAKKANTSKTLPQIGLILGIVATLLSIMMMLIFLDILKSLVR
ncbi:hypothetical protein [Flavobacterium chilense]|uniref:DUF4190 domain-containing protein n=1 Tax=Flavobacterium chilense TaxID=946677 RepID=A0A1M6YBR3_9FLAO|nr:hypothetical protein [Flavobacterium chilense]SHL15435.1 hypothetical protein SAMN05444484_101498 [Flavobacterium chilense]